jgi:hypothetical protein
MKHSYILLFLFFFSVSVFAATDTITIPVYRQYFHDQINENQKSFDLLDNQTDYKINVTDNNEINAVLTDVVFRKIDSIQDWIELDTFFSKNNDKIRLLKYLDLSLDKFQDLLKKKEVSYIELPVVVEQIEDLIERKNSDLIITGIVKNLSFPLAKIITEAFYDSKDNTEAQKIIYFKYSKLHPETILNTITKYPNELFTDSLLQLASRLNPSQVYTFAQSTATPISKIIHNSNDKLTQLIVKLTYTSNALLFFPFLDDLFTGKKSIDNLQTFIGMKEDEYDSVGYYKLLVKTEIDYYNRMISQEKDTPIAMFGSNGLRETLKDKAIRHFINPINVLHNENNLSIRMKAIDPLSPQEIYFMIVMGESEIYTSSYKHSFNRMLQKLGAKPSTDSLLLSVNFDFFKKFIKMTANYNRLDTFLRNMPKQNSTLLMKAFVANLDKSENLEDATDVADSYSSINDINLQKTILNYVIENENQAQQQQNQKGTLIYNLLKNIFLSEDSANHINITDIAGIASIYDIDKSELQDDSGRIVEQVFFYGDEDGKLYFPQFLNSFSLKEWRITKKEEWVEIKSIKGNVNIYANLPLDYDANLDDTAQAHLIDYLSENDLNPTVVVHRGHSYWLPGTIKRMPSSAKIIILGSCGGFKNLNKILAVAPNAHIISTKEIGAGDINRPIFNKLNQTLINNNKVIWKTLWADLNDLFTQDKNKNVRESWESYIPPYRNLGAIFIKAYNKKSSSIQ